MTEELTRYDIDESGEYECENGWWCRYDDAREIIDELKDTIKRLQEAVEE